VADPRSYLVQITTRLALDRLDSARARRESYVGPWLPEPVLTGLLDGRSPSASSPPAPEATSTRCSPPWRRTSC
jgi:RNA polymerase sigma-70 factor (ECF subfamily)